MEVLEVNGEFLGVIEKVLMITDDIPGVLQCLKRPLMRYYESLVRYYE